MFEELCLERIRPTKNQMEHLFEQLRRRTHNISHKQMPTFSEHVKFVRRHPYRMWFLIKVGEEYIGNAYVQFDNSIGLSLLQIKREDVPRILQAIQKEIQPLPEIKSVRKNGFHINVAPSNTSLLQIFKSMGLSESQRSFDL